MMENYSIRAAARESLTGRWINPVVATLVFFVVSALIVFVPIVNIASGIFFTIPLTFGMTYAFYDYYKKRNDNLLDNMFQRTFNRNYLKIVVVSLLWSVIIFVGGMLLIVPGVIASLGLALVPFILVEHPEMGSWEIICESWNRMKGHKAQLFWLQLSFIGWFILSCITFGVGYLWLIPYMTVSLGKFYEELTPIEVVSE